MAHWIDTKCDSFGGFTGTTKRPIYRSRFGGWSFVGLLAQIAETIYAWQCRAEERCQLMEMNDRLLKDIGISRSEADEEGRKPFWAA